MSDPGLVLVTGATGSQGGAVAGELLRRGWAVRAFVRDPDKPAARALAEQGAELAQGDLDDVESLRRAMAGVDGVFSVQPLTLGDSGPEIEARQGKAVASAARESGVGHLVYSSVGGAERGTGIGHFESKWAVEQHLASLDLPVTVLRPVFFMENLLGFGVTGGTGGPGGEDRLIRLALRPSTRLQMVAVADIGVFAADAFSAPASYVGRRIELAGDQLTGPQIAETYEAVTGVRSRFEEQPLEELRAYGEEGVRMFEWFNESGYQADIPALRASHPGLRTLAAWLGERLAGKES
jgi:uncharacterized protein YbjT (DUF2867 family)